MSDDREHRIDQSDAQLAGELAKAMDDPTEWGEPIDEDRPRRSEKRQRSAMISIRLTAEELSAVQEAATARGLSVSRYVREGALRHVRPRAVKLVIVNSSASTPAPSTNVPTATAPSLGYFTREVVPSTAS